MAEHGKNYGFIGAFLMHIEIKNEIIFYHCFVENVLLGDLTKF